MKREKNWQVNKGKDSIFNESSPMLKGDNLVLSNHEDRLQNLEAEKNFGMKRTKTDLILTNG